MKFVAGVIAFGMLAAASTVTSTKPKPKHPVTKHTGTVATASQTKVTAKRHGRTRARRVASGPSYQAHPDPERYQQIQRALADKGYFKGEVNGQWNDDSTDALKRFQADQKLDSDGKINALTLRGLGLGPRHDGTTAPLSGSRVMTVPIDPPPMPTEPPTEQPTPTDPPASAPPRE